MPLTLEAPNPIGTLPALDSVPFYSHAIVDMDPFLPPAAQTNWTTSSVPDGAYLYEGYIRSSGAQNDDISWDRFIPSGTYTIDILGTKNTDAGIYAALIDGVSVGTVDSYAGSLTRNQTMQITGVAIGRSGIHRLTLRMATKNGSASSYIGYLHRVRLRRTAGPNVVSPGRYYMPTVIPIDVFATPHASSGRSTGVSASFVNNGYMQITAQNSYADLKLAIPAGTYNVEAVGSKNTDKGVLTVQLNGVTGPTVDCYNAGGSLPTSSLLASPLNVPYTGVHTLRLTNPTKNGSSSGYEIALSALQLRKTAGPATASRYVYPRVVDVDPFLPPSAQTNWATNTIDTSCLYNGYCKSSGAQNALMRMDMPAGPGTYTFELIHTQNTDAGIYTLSIDGVDFATTIDGYAASITRNTVSQLTSVPIPRSGLHQVALTMKAKNASSSDYAGYGQHWRLLCTA